MTHSHEVPHYADLSPVKRAFLESLADQEIVELANIIRFYHDLSPDARAFLVSAQPETMVWLKNATSEEVKQLRDTSRLFVAGGRVGKFLFWLGACAVGIFLMMSQLGGYLRELLNILSGRGHP